MRSSPRRQFAATFISISALSLALLFAASFGLQAKEPGSAAPPAPPTREEAKARARLLHETVHGSLLVMHRDLFREDEKFTLPARSLDDVFAEVKARHGVEMAWLAVNADAMDVSHAADDDFEKKAVEAIAAGAEEFDAVEGDRYRFAGRVRLASECLKCHLPNRTSTEDRAAAVTIAMPVLGQ